MKPHGYRGQKFRTSLRFRRGRSSCDDAAFPVLAWREGDVTRSGIILATEETSVPVRMADGLIHQAGKTSEPIRAHLSLRRKIPKQISGDDTNWSPTV